MKSWTSPLLALLVGGLSSCGGDDAPYQVPALPNLPEDVPFLAFANDFSNYDKWTCIKLTQEVADGHIAGSRKVCINHLSPPGAKEWPKGTVIVKELPDQLGGTQHLAMVKRGAGFNPYGAKGWEWFELTPGGTDLIRWRGYSPPEGETYGGVAGGGLCSPCHSEAADNDYVYSFELTR